MINPIFSGRLLLSSQHKTVLPFQQKQNPTVQRFFPLPRFSAFSPMLASNVDLTKLQYPVLVSPKMDGIRGIVKDGKLISRSLKLIPNETVQTSLSGNQTFEGFDGELISGDPKAPDAFKQSTSLFMSKKKVGPFTFYVFDLWNSIKPFKERYQELLNKVLPDFIKRVPQVEVHNEKELLEQEAKWLAEGYEGMMIRKPDGGYINGRSTVEDGTLLKLKRFSDAEAVIEDFEPLILGTDLANSLVGEADKKANKNTAPLEAVGSFVVRDIKSGVQFRLGTGGATLEERKSMWKKRESLKGKIVKYKFFNYGNQEKPRHPVFLGFRDPKDMS